MKNYLKFVVAMFGVTIATFGSITKVTAKVNADGGHCKSYGFCGTANNGANIDGNYTPE